MILVEACVTSLSESTEAVRAGAQRLELCSRLETGGLTPPDDLVHAVRANVRIPLFVMIRPRAGTFHATAPDVMAMQRQIAELGRAGADGFVLGVLDRAGNIDAGTLRDLVSAAGRAPVTFHRAFDEVRAPVQALESLVEAGVARILTAGGAETAWAGRSVLRELVRTSQGRITIMAGGAVREDHVEQLIHETGVSEVHARASAIPGVVSATRRIAGSARLRLLPWAPRHLLALIDSAASFERSFGLPAADGLRAFLVSGELSPAYLASLRAATVADPWLHGFAVIDRASDTVVGMASFKGPPDGQGIVEIAYGIVPQFEGRGYATEAAGALVSFAFGDDRVRTIRAHTLPAANASTRVLTKNGFVHIGEVIDPEDGRVWRWELQRNRE